MEIHATEPSASSVQKAFLSPVEKRIVELHREGKAPVDIAKALNISIRLVQTKLNEFATIQPVADK
jgi:DNA-binding CsgD family transcriptional regulator